MSLCVQCASHPDDRVRLEIDYVPF